MSGGDGEGLRALALRALALDRAEQVAEHGVFVAAGRRGVADKVEDVAVLHAVFGEALNFAVSVEIDRDHPLIGDAGLHEADRTIGALRDVIERFAAHRCDGRRGAEHDQHLFLRGAERDLLKRPVGQHVAALEGLADAEAAAQQKRKRHRCRASDRRSSVALKPVDAPHFRTAHLASKRRVPYAESTILAIGSPTDPPRPALRNRSISMILPGIRRRSQARIIAALYGAVVAQARCASFYTDYGVPDTVEGRFDLIVVHLVLLLRRLGQESRKETGQETGPE